MTYNTMAKRKIVIRSQNDLQYNGQKKIVIRSHNDLQYNGQKKNSKQKPQ